jgi:CubicO group peptidase (beta-lactamase class C family)
MIDDLVKAFMTRYRVPGLSVAVARCGIVEHAAGYGLANVELQTPATADTVYQTASVGKQFTASLILMMLERGLLRLDDSIGPHFNGAWSNITARHLLSHTSGISDDGFGSLNLRLDYTDDELVAAIASTPLQSEPGAAFSYSNSGYILLGLLAGRITGRFYGDLLTDWIFAPLEMTTARIISEEDIVPNRAAGYRLESGVLRNQEYVSPGLNRTADGGLYVTVLDLAKWDRALYTGAILTNASREAMWTSVKDNYGFGWSISMTPRGRLVEHDGEWQGFSTHFARLLDEGLSVMVLANLAGVPIDELVKQILG